SSGSTQRSKDDFTQRIKQVLSNVSDNGFNTVILQTRPYADSFYPSQICPPSKYVTGSYKNNFSYDPIKILIEEAHDQALSVQGWINPLRAMTISEISDVSNKYQIKKWYLDNTKNGLYIVEVDKRLYLNPAYDGVRDLIIAGVDEMLKSYSFDGIHMDDYFYPTTNTSFDQKAYNDYKASGGGLSLKGYRYDVLNKLVKGLYDKVKEYDKELLFGISPQGNMSNAIDVTLADVKEWCSKEGYIDYICPQVYFGFEHQTQAFDKVCMQWQNIIKTPKVKLIIGLSLGKALSKTDQWAGSGKDEWANNSDILKRCIEYTLTLDKCEGVAFFCYQYFYEPSTSTTVSATKAECDNFIPVLKKANW
ncbi:MAG: family 10 glycosylhydrolase, partial [Clostridia bacterium]|nr:family 10 glycosylhydrolase [Clostridia bacterium]